MLIFPCFLGVAKSSLMVLMVLLPMEMSPGAPRAFAATRCTAPALTVVLAKAPWKILGSPAHRSARNPTLVGG